MNYQVRFYKTAGGKIPFSLWLKKMAHAHETEILSAVQLRIERLEDGNFGLVRSLGGGLFEIKIDRGPGYRIYYSKFDLCIVLLLCAGDKRTQRADIEKAKEYLQDYKKWRSNNG